TETGKAVLRLATGRRGRPHALLWEWRSGAATAKVEFGDPRASTGYALCLYGDQSTDAPVLLRATAPPGRTCSRRQGCWRADAKGFDYRSSTGTPDGLHAVTLREGGAGRARITVKGDGRHLVLPTLPLPLTPPATVQLRKLDASGPCWSAT